MLYVQAGGEPTGGESQETSCHHSYRLSLRDRLLFLTVSCKFISPQSSNLGWVDGVGQTDPFGTWNIDDHYRMHVYRLERNNPNRENWTYNYYLL